MNWLLFGLGAALFASIGTLLQKTALKKEHAAEYSCVFSLIMAVFAFCFLPWVDLHLGFSKILLLYVFSWFYTLAFYFLMKSIRHMEISLVIPLINLDVIFVALFGMVFLNEFLSNVQWVGLLFVLFGAYVLETTNLKNFKEPFLNLRKNKYSLFIVFSLLFYAASILSERFVVTSITTPINYLFFIHIFVAINFLLIMVFEYDGIKGIKHGFLQNKGWILLGVLFIFLNRVFTTYGLSLQSAALLKSVKSLSILFTVLFAGEIFKEKNLKRRFIASLFMLVGIILISL